MVEVYMNISRSVNPDDIKPFVMNTKLKAKYKEAKSPMTFPAKGIRCGGASCSACKS